MENGEWMMDNGESKMTLFIVNYPRSTVFRFVDLMMLVSSLSNSVMSFKMDSLSFTVR